MQVASSISAAFEEAVRRDGLAADPRLGLLQWSTGAPAADAAPLRGPDDLGVVHECLLDGHERTRRGAWYTPQPVADELVRLALPLGAPAAPVMAADPACGGGAFLLAAARHLHAAGRSPSETVRSLWGSDVDPVAAAVSEAALWWWSARSGDPALPTVAVGDPLGDLGIPAAAAVVGNPPFRGQLRDRTVVAERERDGHRRRFGGAVGAYTDPAWLFLLAGARAVVPGGRVVLLQPHSLLGARDAEGVRTAVEALGAFEGCWIGDPRLFDAAVDVCAPLFVRGDPARSAPWTGWLADALGVPDPPVPAEVGGCVGDLATIHAGFRDEFYGVAAAVIDGGEGNRVVTAGAIDPFEHRKVPVRLDGTRWSDPRVLADRVDGRAETWVRRQARPKILVATQTKVLEALADPSGSLVGSVPVLAVVPHEPDRLWHLLAVLQSPVASAVLLRRSAGTALSRHACRPTGSLLAQLPLPSDQRAWDVAAELARSLSGGGSDAAALDRFARAADAMYGIADDGVRSWWFPRLPRR